MKNCLSLLIYLVGTTFCIGQAIEIAPAPKWVEYIEAPRSSAVSKYDVNSGYYFKLIDYQVNMIEESYFRHFVQNVLTSGGVSNVSQIQVTYDSSYQTVVFHNLQIHRGGNIINRTSEVAFEYIKNEQQLQSSIYTGEVTALVVLNDIRKGDMIEFSYSLVGSNPVFKGNKSYLIPINDINPIDRMFVRILYPEGENYQYKVSKENITIEKKSLEGISEIRTDRTDLPECKIEESMVPWIIPYDYLEISNTKTWKEVNDWALELFNDQEDDQIAGIFSEIFYPEFTLDDKINAIIDFVQDEVRYMGIESGIGSIMPFSPNQVIAQRFGDCKDKSLLLTSMLKAIGVNKSYPALVNSLLLGEIANHIPSGYRFDHCIVTFNHEGKTYWIDPTYSYQGGDYKNTQTFAYHKALVVKEGTTDLTDMINTEKVSSSLLEEVITVTDYEKPGELTSVTTFKGARADYTRQVLEYYSLRELSEFYKYSYSQVFPTIMEREKMRVSDNMQNNQLVTTESYSIPNIWNEDQEGYEGKRTITYNPISLYSYVNSTSCEVKTYPVFMGHPLSYKQVTEIEFPEAISIDSLVKTYDNKGFTFTKEQYSLTPTVVRLSYEYTSKANAISPEEFPKVCSDINEIVDNLPIVFYFSKGIDFSKLGMKIHELKFKDVPLNSTNDIFYISEVIDESKNFNGLVGIINTQKKEGITAVRIENGAEEQFKEYLLNHQRKPTDAIPLTLTIKQLIVSEKDHKKPNPKARLEFDYRVSFMKDGVKYTYQFIDNIESEGSDILEQHQLNLHASLEQLIGGIKANKFKKSKN